MFSLVCDLGKQTNCAILFVKIVNTEDAPYSNWKVYCFGFCTACFRLNANVLDYSDLLWFLLCYIPFISL